MKTLLKTLPLLLVTTLAMADGPSDLRAKLNALRGREPVRVTLEYETWREVTYDKKPEVSQATLTLNLAEDTEGLHVTWTPKLIEQADREEHLRDLEHVAPTPLREAMKDLDPGRLSHLLSQADVLLHLVEGSQFVEEKAEAYRGKPARLLVFRYEPRIPEPHARRLISKEASLKLWMAPDGTPLATEAFSQYRGRTSKIARVFQSSSKLTTEYALAGSRLIVASRTSEEFLAEEDLITKAKKVLTLAVVRS